MNIPQEISFANVKKIIYIIATIKLYIFLFSQHNKTTL